MLKRTLLFGKPCHLSVKNRQLLYSLREADAEPRVIPLEDVGFAVLEHGGITLSTQLVQRFIENGTAVIFCDGTHHPCAMLQNFAGHSTHAEVLRRQIEAPLPTRKRLWQQTVKAKIRNQASLLEQRGCADAVRLKAMVPRVKSDDVDNREAVAAKIYWGALFNGMGFRRDTDGDGLNGLLNYGYAILRAAAARALVGSGLLCAIGIHHCNRYNSFGLADDVMEPYRPFVDRIVREWADANGACDILTPQIKKGLLQVLACDVCFTDMKRPLMVGLSQTSASLVRCLGGEDKRVAYPMIES